jgi:hypothetical protein
MVATTMRGAPADGDSEQVPQQPAEVLDSWIRDRLDEMQGAQAQRLVHACAQLNAELLRWDNAALAQALVEMNFAGRDLSFLPLHRNWVMRLAGRHRSAYARFIASHSRVNGRAGNVQSQAAKLEAGRERQADAAGAWIAEIESAQQAIHAAVEEAVNWLQSMCTQLAGARTGGSDDSRMQTLAESAQFHTLVLKRFQAAGTMAHDIVVRAAHVLERRAALLDKVRGGMKDFEANWRPRLGRLLDDLRANRSAAPAAPKAIEAHNDFMKRLAAAVDASGALQHEERLLSEHIAILQEHLRESPHDEH